jgi:hypothetical protein
LYGPALIFVIAAIPAAPFFSIIEGIATACDSVHTANGSGAGDGGPTTKGVEACVSHTQDDKHSPEDARTNICRDVNNMAGLKDKRGFIDKDRLDLSERKAVEYWMKRWGVTRDQLTAAHRKVGLHVKDIAAELGKKR